MDGVASDGFDYRAYWERGLSWPDYVRRVRKNRGLWSGVYRTARVPEWAIERMRGVGDGLRLLAIAEEWCGDASNTVPLFGRLAEAVPGLELRIVARDENPALMDRHLTNGSRSIPIVVALDETFQPVAVWGPRPAELQAFVLGEKRRGERPASEIYRDARRWYAQDAGATTLHELLDRVSAAVATRS